MTGLDFIRSDAGFWLLPVALLLAHVACADSTQARCDIYPRGSDQASAVVPCSFSQRQGFVTIRRADGVVHDLRPEAGIVGNFLDEQGRRVFRQRGLGSDGVIWRLPDESIYLYWSTAGLPGNRSPDPGQPYTTADFDAVTQLHCRSALRLFRVLLEIPG